MPRPPCYCCPPGMADPQNTQIDTLEEINSFYTYNDPIPGCGCAYLAEKNSTSAPKNLMAVSGEANFEWRPYEELPENADFIVLVQTPKLQSDQKFTVPIGNNSDT